MNLLNETHDSLLRGGKTPADVKWVGNSEFYFTWNEFASIADFEYDDGYGGQNIAHDLLVVGKDFWLERHEYDGSEWWEYKELPKKPEKHSLPNVLDTGSWAVLEPKDEPIKGEE